ncbi:transporter substrate-binding domain-containing protein [Rheinheimera sp.]|uniref:substrate-binding periplasmic protein n=1 Tax=Rheinheimera sp. TaxID=1869214 RepID=UPI00307F8D31
MWSRLLASLLLLSHSVWAEQVHPTLTWCLDHFPRFHAYEDGKAPYGPSVDLMQELAKRAGFTLKFTARTPSARCFRQMETGEVDLMSNLNYTDERANTMWLFPYNERIAESLYLLGSDSRAIQALNQLVTLRIATVRNYTYHPSLMKMMSESSRHVEIDSIATGFEMLLRGRVDGLVVPTQSSLDVIAQKQELHFKFRRAPVDFSVVEKRYINIGLSRKSPHLQLKPQIEAAIAAMVADGTVKRLYAFDPLTQGPTYLVEP